MISKPGGLWALILLSMLMTAAWATHGGFQDHYTDYLGVRCCHSARDCMPMPVSLVSREGDQVHLLVAGVLLTLPAGSVHLSEDVQTYVCLRNPQMPPSVANVRCAFWSVAG